MNIRQLDRNSIHCEECSVSLPDQMQWQCPPYKRKLGSADQNRSLEIDYVPYCQTFNDIIVYRPIGGKKVREPEK